MARFNNILTNFTAGELSPRMQGRVDIARYFNGCRQLRNSISMTHGGSTRRPGTYYVSKAKYPDKKVRIIPFEFSTVQAYILEFGDKYIRFYKNKGQILSGDEAYEIETPYLEADLFDLYFEQSADVLYIAHPSYAPRKVTRTEHTAWTITEQSFTTNPFSGEGNYPRCVAFFEERLCYAGTNNKPQTVWASVSGDYENFTMGTNADDALEYTINADMVNIIQWMVPLEYLALGTPGGIWKFSGTGGDPLTPTSVGAHRQSTRGVETVAGMLINDEVLYIQRGGRKVRELVYDYRKDGYNTPDITILAEHITKGNPTSLSGIKCWDYQQEPDAIVWSIRNDGVLLGLTYEKDQEVIGWHPHYTEGKFESVAIIPGDVEDEIWLSTSRDIDEVETRFIEYMVPREFGGAKEDAFFVDCGMTFDGGDPINITGATSANPVVITSVGHDKSTGQRVRFSSLEGTTELNDHTYLIVRDSDDAFHLHDDDGVDIDGTGFGAYTGGGTAEVVANTFAGLNHLIGEEVSICADGGAEANQTVPATGIITTLPYFNKVHIGLPSDWLVQPMKLEAGATIGTSQGQLKKIDHFYLRFFETAACKIGPDEDNQKDVMFDFQDENLFSDDVRIGAQGGATREGDMVLTSDKPLPVTILAIVIEGTTFERNINV